ncbi:hypothetical protein GUY44_03725 [Pimelobacter simplex]|uniref:von Willebrand factor type A domain protein n=1 Tax=Nocardioides simplex TaxID=2045 RepID=A0A0A1DPX3_NOCSI|nr:hypothetical protein [Pimelobacter simplex]AIY19419.1 von Willebrand factor type A domain protein [Pimelobacter simplex]MCG8149574.1 hypothetical protein [Pimelobacter simplex]GEB16058.1 hypothetical protein NSI01_43730 [Pimelobacter simplex]SFM81592.1 hypothetical protein SAMN05421671_3458 [Pimelobacter simplex]
MRARPVPVLLAGAGCLAWLTLTSGYGAAAASGQVDLGGADLPDRTSTDRGRPTAIAPGLWRASPLEPDLPQYFSYDRRMSGSRVHIGVAGLPPGASGDGLRISAGVATADSTDLTDCGTADDSAESNVPQAVLGERVVVGGESGSTGEACRSAGTVRIEVSRAGSEPAAMPYVIKVVEEAPSAALPEDAEPDDEPSYAVPEPVAEPEAVAGGTSFDDAPELDARDETRTVTAQVRQGTERLWRVPLTWGDLPVVRVDVPVAEGDQFDYGGPALTLHLIDPLRGRLRFTDSASDDSATGDYRGAPEDEVGEPTRLVASGFPVSQVDERVPGDYWVSLAVAPPAEGDEPVDVPVTLTVSVERTSDGAPAYDSAVLSQDKSAGPEGYTPETPFLVGEDTFAEVASGSPVGDGDGWFSVRRGAGLGLAAASAACLVAGVVRLRSRRG